MTVKVTPALKSNYDIKDFIALLSEMIFEANIDDESSSRFNLSIGRGLNATVDGRGFRYATEGRDTVLVGGTVESVEIRQGNRLLGEIANADLDGRALSRAVIAEYNGNAAAVDNLLLSKAWEYRGTDSADVALATDRLPGGGPLFNLRKNDILDGAGGNDRLASGDGNDRLFGGDGSDILFGGNGNDTVAGDRGNDILHGGKGKDVFVFDGRDGSDRVTDFELNRDHLRFEDGSWQKTSLVDRADGTLVRVGAVSVFLEDVDAQRLDRGDFVY